MFTEIAIIGDGNIGTWLYKQLQTQKNLSVISVSSRKIETLPKGLNLYIFALKDDIYDEVLKQIPFQMPHAVHTSGSLSQQILAPFADRVGVIYPYQTIRNTELTSDKLLVNKKNAGIEVPICVEGDSLEFENMLFNWACTVFRTVNKINEQQRFAMHLAAVFANNFTNAMYSVAYQIFKENHLDWSLIFPLLENTLEKAKYNDPRLVQTGPAKRGDSSIMEKHCDALKDEDWKNLYQLVSKIIHSLPLSSHPSRHI